jgi:uncharacterized membrane protein
MTGEIMNRHIFSDDSMKRVLRNSTDPSILRLGLNFQPFEEPPIEGLTLRSRRPLHPRLIGSGAVLLIAVLATDVIYANTLLFQWENFSIWLLTSGLVLAAGAGLALVVDIVQHRIKGIDWLRFSAFTAAALLSLLNALVHSRDAHTAVVPDGLELSLLVSAILVVVGRRGWSVAARHSSRTTRRSTFFGGTMS